MTYSPNEPAVNVYSAGGDFPPHEDGQELTVLVVLSHSSTFAGGGTAYWTEKIDTTHGGSVGDLKPSLMLKAPRGTAVIFGGDVTHAGLPVTSGVRQVFVASFSLRRGIASPVKGNASHVQPVANPDERLLIGRTSNASSSQFVQSFLQSRTPIIS